MSIPNLMVADSCTVFTMATAFMRLYIFTSGQSKMTTCHIAAAHGQCQFNGICQVAPVLVS